VEKKTQSFKTLKKKTDEEIDSTLDKISEVSEGERGYQPDCPRGLAC
jgi:hypothetical protein